MVAYDGLLRTQSGTVTDWQYSLPSNGQSQSRDSILRLHVGPASVRKGSDVRRCTIETYEETPRRQSTKRCRPGLSSLSPGLKCFRRRYIKNEKLHIDTITLVFFLGVYVYRQTPWPLPKLKSWTRNEVPCFSSPCPERCLDGVHGEEGPDVSDRLSSVKNTSSQHLKQTEHCKQMTTSITLFPRGNLSVRQRR